MLPIVELAVTAAVAVFAELWLSFADMALNETRRFSLVLREVTSKVMRWREGSQPKSANKAAIRGAWLRCYP
jgi:hypothetical protein